MRRFSLVDYPSAQSVAAAGGIPATGANQIILCGAATAATGGGLTAATALAYIAAMVAAGGTPPTVLFEVPAASAESAASQGSTNPYAWAPIADMVTAVFSAYPTLIAGWVVSFDLNKAPTLSTYPSPDAIRDLNRFVLTATGLPTYICFGPDALHSASGLNIDDYLDAADRFLIRCFPKSRANGRFSCGPLAPDWAGMLATMLALKTKTDLLGKTVGLIGQIAGYDPIREMTASYASMADLGDFRDPTLDEVLFQVYAGFVLGAKDLSLLSVPMCTPEHLNSRVSPVTQDIARYATALGAPSLPETFTFTPSKRDPKVTPPSLTMPVGATILIERANGALATVFTSGGLGRTLAYTALTNTWSSASGAALVLALANPFQPGDRSLRIQVNKDATAIGCRLLINLHPAIGTPMRTYEAVERFDGTAPYLPGWTAGWDGSCQTSPTATNTLVFDLTNLQAGTALQAVGDPAEAGTIDIFLEGIPFESQDEMRLRLNEQTDPIPGHNYGPLPLLIAADASTMPYDLIVVNAAAVVQPAQVVTIGTTGGSPPAGHYQEMRLGAPVTVVIAAAWSVAMAGGTNPYQVRIFHLTT